MFPSSEGAEGSVNLERFTYTLARLTRGRATFSFKSPNSFILSAVPFTIS